MYSSSSHSALESPECADEVSTDDMDTSPRSFEATKRWYPQDGERDLELFENGEYIPSAIDTTQHSYYAACDRDKLGVRYQGIANHENDWGTVRANHPLPRRRRMCYFEATIASQGEQGCITVGLVGGSFPMHKQPGKEPGSYGLEGSNRSFFTESSPGRIFGNPVSTGDTVGVGVNFKKMEAFLTHNGQLLGAAFPGIRSAVDVAGLYPCVGLHSQGEAVRLNFGQRPFLFDLSACMAEEDYREQAAVAAVPVCPSLLRSLVRDYLLHQGCEKTLRSLEEADGKGGTDWAKTTASAAAAAGSSKGVSTPPPPPPPSAAQNGNAQKEFSNGGGTGDRNGISGDGSAAIRTTSPRPLQEDHGGSGIGGRGRSASTQWGSAEVAWGGRARRGNVAVQGQAFGNNSSRRSSQDMDVDLAAGVRGRSAEEARSEQVGRQREGLSTSSSVGNEAESRNGGGASSGATPGPWTARRAAAGDGSSSSSRGALIPSEDFAAEDLLRHLQRQLGVQGPGGVFVGAGSSGDSGGGDNLFIREGAARGVSGVGGGRNVGGVLGEPEEEAHEDEDDDDDDDDDDDEALEEEEEEEEEEDDDPVISDDDEEVDPEDHRNGGFADVIIPWIPQEASHREMVRPVSVTDLLAGGKGGNGGGSTPAAVLHRSLSLRTRLRRAILSGAIDRATELLQTDRPGLLERRTDVRFALKCQAFIELVKRGELTTAVALAQRDLFPFLESSRVRFDSPPRGGIGQHPRGPTTPTNGHVESDSTSVSSDTIFSGSSVSPPGAGSGGARDGSRKGVARGEGGRVGGRGGPGTRFKGVRGGNNDGSESEEIGAERRTRKRRTRSYDRGKVPGDGQESDNEASSGRSFGSGPADSMRSFCFPSTLFGAPSMYDSKLKSVMGLLAYKDPANSPLGHLVSGLQNQAIADKVNDAVLAADVLPRRGTESPQLSLASANVAAPTSGLELTIRHLLATQQASRDDAGEQGHSSIRPHMYF